MSSFTDKSINIAFFGSTGGCANACLTYALKNGYKASALARTPSKLQTQLLSQGLDQATIDNNLTIIQGDATDVEVIKRTLSPEKNNGKMVSLIISGLGGPPKMTASLQPITFENPNICENSTNAILSAIEVLQPSTATEKEKPILVAISTTGISSGPRDVPYLLYPLWHFLEVPHKDKKKMEHAIFDSPSKRLLRGAIVVRPTLLVGDHSITSGKGWKTLNVGTEKKPALGHSIQRADVGEWIFEEMVKAGGEKWLNEKVTLSN
ncbi:conserved hypothetical protein [Histoplasma capsulatum var. duboisii H88]|uniref:NADB Rossman superfamily domain-containing protein n=2 Tax=Ajellomyces capsulatus TaxID=5037 RepID=F0UJI8_AJEC8|nr:conserved hypothetical protein [Histoplasma capsulatum H143]EGC46579.1 conserved hypothetical protein [Histoplasma capsulatum var. duboisii H88]QSS57201.1 NADB Rossman superfamily domain-containing protein [Histoplasma capsulatum var. duboisii H88]